MERLVLNFFLLTSISLLLAISVFIISWRHFEVTSMLSNLQPYSLEPYKSKTDKLTLLDEAIRYHDGNAVIAVSNQSGK